jgi:hypothetical protein
MKMNKTFLCTKALSYKTPAKRKRGLEDGESHCQALFDLSLHLPFFKDKEDAPITDIASVLEVLMQMDKGVLTNNVTMMNFIHNYQNEYGKAGEATRLLWLQMEALSSEPGSVPAQLSFNYLAP